MKSIAIIGAGQSGSRHLQGLLNYKAQQEIYVLDPSQTSLKLAKQRASEINHKNDIHFVNDWAHLPQKFDLVIIATNANVRESVAVKLIENFQVDFLVLEKVLFQELESFSRIGNLIEKYKIKTWVNHSRRMFESYKILQEKLYVTAPRVYQVVGGNWGLACNALHFIDLFEFLSRSNVASLDVSGVDDEILPSKREGFIEFTGTVRGLLNDGSQFLITSFKGEPSATTITVFDLENRYMIQEAGTPHIYCLNKENTFKAEISPFLMEYQSALTSRLAAAILESGNCDLPRFEHARCAHEIFITSLLGKYNQIQKPNSKILPIT